MSKGEDDAEPVQDPWALLVLDATASLNRFIQMYSSGSVASNKQGPDFKPYRIHFNIEPDADHYLYKAADDTHGRKYAMQKRPQDFQPDRAARLHWIGLALSHPHAIYRELRRQDYHFYVVNKYGQDFVVVTQDTLDGGRFITAYLATEPKWSRDKVSLKKLYPSKGAKKK